MRGLCFFFGLSGGGHVVVRARSSQDEGGENGVKKIV